MLVEDSQAGVADATAARLEMTIVEVRILNYFLSSENVFDELWEKVKGKN